MTTTQQRSSTVGFAPVAEPLFTDRERAALAGYTGPSCSSLRAWCMPERHPAYRPQSDRGIPAHSRR